MPLDVFDELELSIDDKLTLSDEFKKFVLEEVGRQIKKIPISKMISKTVDHEFSLRDKEDDIFDDLTREETQKSQDKLEKISLTVADLKKEKDRLIELINELKKEEEEFMEKIRKKYDDLKSDILNQPRYEFGGFSPQFNDLNIGDPATDGNWRIKKIDDDLVVQVLLSGTWTAAARFVRP